MLDGLMYVVLWRVFSRSGQLWIKARKSGWQEADLPRPVSGERPVICNALLSPVQCVVDIPNGYEIVTENSRYKALLMTNVELHRLVQREGFTLDHVGHTGSLYYRP